MVSDLRWKSPALPAPFYHVSLALLLIAMSWIARLRSDAPVVG